MERVFNAKRFWMSSYLPIFENFEKTLYWIMGEWCVSNFETLLYHTQSWVKHDWIWVMDWCVECGCMLVSSSNFSAWENVEENKNEAFLILFLRHSELNQCVGRSHSKQRYRDGIEIKILRDVSNESVREDDFFLNFQKFQRSWRFWKRGETIWSRHVVLHDLIYTTEKRDSKIVR